VAITQPGGAGTKICIYDDAGSASGTGYTMAEISAAFPAVIVDNGTFRKTYRCIQDIQVGDTGVGVATTTLADTNVGIFFDSGKILRARDIGTSWFVRLGTKVGTGNRASGKDGCDLVLGAAASFPRQMFMYGGSIRQKTGAMTITQNFTSEFINVLVQSAATGSTPIGMGVVTGSFLNLYNVDISHATSTAQVLSGFFSATAERITVSAAAPTTFLSSGSASVTCKDLAMFGSPTQSDLRWATQGAGGWKFIRPLWTGNAPKFSANIAFTHVAGLETYEYWLYDVKCVDAAGAGVAGIPVRLTDVLGNVQVDTTTDANGEITFGTGVTEKAVVVMEHYAVAGVYTQRHRGPFYSEFNLPSQTGYNPNYKSHRYYWEWPGASTVTLTAGSFEDVGDIIQMQDPAGVATIWTECELA
jgi:hypothetical protein